MAPMTVTVVISGQEQNQILLIEDEEDLNSNLERVRALLADQGVAESCLEYSFLTATGDAISSRQEAMIALKHIVTKGSAKQSAADNSSPGGFEKLDLFKEKNETSPPFKAESNNSSDRSGNMRIRLAPNAALVEGEVCHLTSSKGISKSIGSKRECPFRCPFRGFSDVFNIHDYVSLGDIVKVFLVALVAMSCVVVVATCSLFMLTTLSGVLDLGGHVTSQPQPMGEADLKLQRVELHVTYKMAELERRLVEMAGVYRADLKSLMQEVSDLQTTLSQKIGPTRSWNYGNDSEKRDHSDDRSEKKKSRGKH